MFQECYNWSFNTPLVQVAVANPRETTHVP